MQDAAAWLLLPQMAQTWARNVQVQAALPALGPSLKRRQTWTVLPATSAVRLVHAAGHLEGEDWVVGTWAASGLGWALARAEEARMMRVSFMAPSRWVEIGVTSARSGLVWAGVPTFSPAMMALRRRTS